MDQFSLTPRDSLKIQIRQILDDIQLTLPNGWTIRVDASERMMERLLNWMETGDDTLDDVVEEVNQVLAVIVTAYEIAGLLLPNDRLLGDQLGEYVIVSRQFFAQDKQVTFEVAYYEAGAGFR